MKIKDWLEKEGITQRAFAALVGVNYPSMSKYCSGKMKPRADKIKKIQDLTNGEVKLEDWHE